AVTLAHVRYLDGEVLPHAVQAEGHDVVHHVVLLRDRGKHLGHLLLLELLVNRLEAEVGRLVAHDVLSGDGRSRPWVRVAGPWRGRGCRRCARGPRGSRSTACRGRGRARRGSPTSKARCRARPRTWA